MTYIITFVESIQIAGPSEVYSAKVLSNGWVEVQWREISEDIVMYPPHVVLNVRMPKKRLTMRGNLPPGVRLAEAPEEEPEGDTL